MRLQAEATCEALQLWGAPLTPLVAPLRLLSDCDLGDHCALGLEAAADIKEAETCVAQAETQRAIQDHI